MAEIIEVSPSGGFGVNITWSYPECDHTDLLFYASESAARLDDYVAKQVVCLECRDANEHKRK